MTLSQEACASLRRACIDALMCISEPVVSVSVQPTPKSEPSADMKRRMREEYLGLGGSPNKVRDGWHFVVVAVSSSCSCLT